MLTEWWSGLLETSTPIEFQITNNIKLMAIEYQQQLKIWHMEH